MRKLLFISLAALMVQGCFKSEEADVIIHNANIITLNTQEPKAQAVAIKNGKIIQVGAEREILNKYAAKQTIDVQGKFVYPGFVDAHCHFLGLGQTLQQVNLQGVESLDAFAEKVKTFAKTNPEGWVFGRGWDESLWTDQTKPTAQFLDELFPNRPVFLKRVDGHSAVANSLAMKMAGITQQTKVQGGLVEVKNGLLTGIVVDEAMDLLDDAMPERTIAKDAKALMKAQQVCFSEGLTTVTDAGLNLKDIILIDSLQQADELQMPMYVMASDNDENKEYFFNRGKWITDLLTVASFKFYADGSLGSRSARLKQHYHDHSHGGMMMNDKAYFQKQAELMKLHGFQMNTHCIGDSAVAMMLDVYANTLGGTNDLRWRIEHAQVVDASDLNMFSLYSIIPSVQPTHALSDRRWAKERLGDERIRGAYAYKDLLATNGVLAFGTDFPVETVSPLRTFFAAVFRKEPGEKGEGWFVEQALSRQEALKAMTIGAAIANKQDSLYGSIEVGKLANFTILNTDLLKDPEDRLANTKVLKTIVHGEVVFEQIK